MKTILIAETSRGIGRATALLFFEKDGNVAGACRPGDCGIARPAFTILDLTPEDETTTKKLARFLSARKVKIDILLNNTGALLASKDLPTVKFWVVEERVSVAWQKECSYYMPRSPRTFIQTSPSMFSPSPWGPAPQKSSTGEFSIMLRPSVFSSTSQTSACCCAFA